MTDEDRYFAQVCRHLGHPVPRFTPLPATPGSLSAAVISNSLLVVATLEWSARAPATLDIERSAVFELEDRSAGALRQLARQTSSFFATNAIEHLYLRSRPERGQYAGNPFNFKIEAAIQMATDLHVSFVSDGSVGSWVRREQPRLPPGTPQSRGQVGDKQRRAIEAALFCRQNRDEARYFADGSAGYG